MTALKTKMDEALKALLPQIADEHFQRWAQDWLKSEDGVHSWGAYRNACEHNLGPGIETITHAADLYYDATHVFTTQMEQMCAAAQRGLDEAARLQREYTTR